MTLDSRVSGSAMCHLTARVAWVGTGETWLAVEPMDMRAGVARALARVVVVSDAAHPRHVYLFVNWRADRANVPVHNGIEVWMAAQRLNEGQFS